MTNEPMRRNVPAPLSQSPNLLDAAIASLPIEQQQSLLNKAIERRIEIDADTKLAELRHAASGAEMNRTIEQVRDLEKSTSADFTMRAEYEGASGRTNIEIKKSNNTVIIVIAIVIGVVAVFLLSK